MIIIEQLLDEVITIRLCHGNEVHPNYAQDESFMLDGPQKWGLQASSNSVIDCHGN